MKQKLTKKLANTLVAVLGATIIVLGFELVTVRYTTEAATIKPFPLRQFYLTPGTFDGASTLAACTTGYHMASLWEILDVSNLEYNTTLGLKADDSGSGPPNQFAGEGWIRTGGPSSADSFPGVGNCSNWTSNTLGDTGSVVYLNADWGISSSSHAVSPWIGESWNCNVHWNVWWVQD